MHIYLSTLDSVICHAGLTAIGMNTLECKALFLLCDTNGDGTVTMLEYVKGTKKYQQQKQEASSNQSEDAKSEDAKSTAERPAKKLQLIELFAQLDTDNSGALSVEELTTGYTPTMRYK